MTMLERSRAWQAGNPWGVNDSFFPPIKAIVVNGEIVGIEDSDVPPEMQRRYDETYGNRR